MLLNDTKIKRNDNYIEQRKEEVQSKCNKFSTKILYSLNNLFALRVESIDLNDVQMYIEF